MSKKVVNLNGQKVTLNMDSKRVQDAVADFIQAVCERQFPIGMVLEHADGDDYILARIKQHSMPNCYRAYLINITGNNKPAGTARNSRKVIFVEEPEGGELGRGYITDLPAERDRFIDPDSDDYEYIEC